MHLRIAVVCETAELKRYVPRFPHYVPRFPQPHAGLMLPFGQQLLLHHRHRGTPDRAQEPELHLVADFLAHEGLVTRQKTGLFAECTRPHRGADKAKPSRN